MGRDIIIFDLGDEDYDVPCHGMGGSRWEDVGISTPWYGMGESRHYLGTSYNGMYHNDDLSEMFRGLNLNARSNNVEKPKPYGNIYKMTCETCNGKNGNNFYIGQTVDFERRMKQHENDLRKEIGVLGRHKLEYHSNEEMRTRKEKIDTASNKESLDRKEGRYIKEMNPSMNRQKNLKAADQPLISSLNYHY